MRGPREAVRRGLVPLVLVGAGLTAGCTGASDDAAPSEPASPTPLSEVDLTGVVAERAPFCDVLDPDSLAEVIGGEPTASDSYGSGERAELAPGLEDVAGEYSCSFERGAGDQRRTARAWLFAQPATPARARGWVEERRADDGCREAGELTFGEPGLVQSCSTGDRLRVTAAGLFGDGWLTCQATAPAGGPAAVEAAELLEVTQRWCAEVARDTAAP